MHTIDVTVSLFQGMVYKSMLSVKSKSVIEVCVFYIHVFIISLNSET